ncbi:hypothetical protein ES707_04221 [subsurface metagenome]
MIEVFESAESVIDNDIEVLLNTFLTVAVPEVGLGQGFPQIKVVRLFKNPGLIFTDQIILQTLLLMKEIKIAEQWFGGYKGILDASYRIISLLLLACGIILSL